MASRIAGCDGVVDYDKVGGYVVFESSIELFYTWMIAIDIEWYRLLVNWWMNDQYCLSCVLKQNKWAYL